MRVTVGTLTLAEIETNTIKTMFPHQHYDSCG